MDEKTLDKTDYCPESQEHFQGQAYKKIDYSKPDNASSSGENEDISPKEKWSPNKYSPTFDKSVSVFDVAAYILSKKGQMTTMKLQKLVYYCQAWSLVWDDKPLFKEDIEAWANGPVIRKLFAHHRGQFEIKNILTGNPDLLSKQQKETIDAVLDYYGDKPSQWLIDLAHMEEPWKKTREGMTDLERGNKKIKLSLIVDYYSSLLLES